MFGIRNLPVQDLNPWMPSCEGAVVIEGADVYDTLCPISKETGYRENALSLLSKVLDPKQQNLIQSIMQAVPSIQERQDISDSDALDMLVSRFDQGSMYENELLRDRLAASLDVLMAQPSVGKDTIQFTEEDTKTVEE